MGEGDNVSDPTQPMPPGYPSNNNLPPPPPYPPSGNRGGRQPPPPPPPAAHGPFPVPVPTTNFGGVPPPPPSANFGGQPPPPPPPPPGSNFGNHIPFRPPISNLMYSHYPCQMTCPHCQQNIITQVTYQVGGFTWLLVILIIVMGLWAGCCFIPLCISACKDAVHYCPNCKTVIGRHSPL